MMKKNRFWAVAVMFTLCLVQVTAQSVRYAFTPTDYTSTDNSRAPQSVFSYTASGFTVKATGQNNVAFKMGGECDGKYFITGDDHWFLVKGSNMRVGSTDSYLWWSNGVNHGSQVAPDHSATVNGEQFFVWDLQNGNPLFSWFNASAEHIALNSNGTNFILAMGLTAGSNLGGTVGDVNYYSDMDIATLYPELMSTLGLSHEALAQQMRTKMSARIAEAETLLATRPAEEADRNKLQNAINDARTVLEAITTENYTEVPAAIETLDAAMEAYRAASRTVSYSFTDDGLLAQWDDLRVRVRFVNDSTVRVTKFIGDESRVEKSLVMLEGISRPVSFAKSESEGLVTLTSEKVRVSYDLAKACVTVFRNSGEELIKELEASLTEKPDGPNAAWQLQQVFSLENGEQIYGMGQLQNGKLSMRGLSTTMIQDNRSIYIPYFYSSKRYALYWDNYSPTTFDDNASGTSFLSTGQAIDYYVLVGTNSDGVLRSWRSLTGKTQLPPLWNFGLYQSKQRYMSVQEVIDVVSRYRSLGVPLDCVVQDWQYWGDDNHWNAMDFLNPNYADYQRMIDEVHAMNAKLMISVWPDFGPATAQYSDFGNAGRLIPIQSYPTNVATRPYDVYDATTRTKFWNYLYQGLMSKGIDALWLDSAEPDDFSNKTTDYDYVTGLDGRTFRSVRNAFPLAHVEGVYDHHLAESALSDKRVSILTRSAFAGMQRTGAFVWSADITSSWETLARQIPAACNFSVSGLPYWNSDTGAFFIGGYSGGVSNPAWRALYTRWTQFSCFCPMMRFHGDQTPREIWQFGAQDDARGDYNNILRYIRLRYRLLPYLYSTAHQVVDADETFMKAMPVAFEDDARCTDVIDQYMFGRAFLVAPVVTDGAAGRNVYLPEGQQWYDFWTGRSTEGGKSLWRQTPQDIMPLYIPAGTVLPFGPEVQYSSEKPWDDIEIRVYAGKNGTFTLYEDALDGYGYKSGEFSEIPFTWDEARQTLTVGARTGSFPGMLSERTFRIVRVSSKKGFGDLNSEIYDKVISYSGTPVEVTLEEAPEEEIETENLTSLIVNPSFEANGSTLNKVAPTGWTVNSSTTWWGVNNGGGNGDPVATDGRFIFGVWDGSNTMNPVISQTIATLPKGCYTLSVDMQASNRASAVRLGKQYVFAGEKKGYFADQLSTAGEGDTYPMQTISVSFEQEEDNIPVTIGVSTEGAPAETWFKIDNFRLTRYPKMPTFISDVRRSLSPDAADSIYDLMGRRLGGIPSSGFYIRGGKKFFVP